MRVFSVLSALGFISLLLTWAVASPIGSSPDDSYHLPSIWCESDSNLGFCQETKEGYELPRIISGVDASCYVQWGELDPNKYKQTAACTSNYLETQEVVTTPWLNQVRGLYPDHFYEISGKLVERNFEFSVVKIRVFWSLVFLVTILIIIMGLSTTRIFVLIPLVLVSSPYLFFIVSSTNPSSAQTSILLGSGASLYFGINSVGIKKVMFLLIHALYFYIGLGIRSDAALFLITTTVAVLVTSRIKLHQKVRWAVFTLPIQISLSISQIVRHSLVSTISTGLDANSGINSNLDLLINNILHFPDFVLGFWGYYWALGWKWEPPISNFLAALMGVMSLALAIRYLKADQISSTAPIYRKQLGTALVFLPIPLISLLFLQTSNAKVGELVQPRYLFPYFVMAIFIIFLSATKLTLQMLTNSRLWECSLIVGMVYQIHSFCQQVTRVAIGVPYDSLRKLSNPDWWWRDFSIGPLELIQINFVACLVFYSSTYFLMKLSSDKSISLKEST